MSKNMNLPLGIHCTDPASLESRLLVSDLRILDPVAAEAGGYGYREVIVPTEPQKPTDEQVAAFIADETTRHVMHLVSLPAAVGQRALGLVRPPESARALDDFTTLDKGFMGSPRGARLDGAGQLHVSKDGEELYVGDHIDARPDPDQRFAIVNVGPGHRWHRLTPTFCRDDMGGQKPVPEVRHAHLRAMQEAGMSLLTYWVRIDSPWLTASGDTAAYNALVSSPVTRYLHEGSTFDAVEPSTALFISTPPAAPAPPYPSLV